MAESTPDRMDCEACDDLGVLIAQEHGPECGPFSRPREHEVFCPLRCEAYRNEMKLRNAYRGAPHG